MLNMLATWPLDEFATWFLAAGCWTLFLAGLINTAKEPGEKL